MAAGRVKRAPGPSAWEFLEEAERQLGLAAGEERSQDAVVLMYRAALRAAGALIEDALRGKKRRPKGSAWSKLRFLRPDLKHWADGFEAYARLASRAGMGLERDLSVECRAELYSTVCDFLDEAKAEVGYLPQVA